MSLSDLLFATPWWVFILLFGGGVAIWWAGNVRLDKALKLVGLAIVLAGVVLILLNVLVTTDKQRAEKQTRKIIADFVDRNWDDLKTRLSPQTTVAGKYKDRDALIKGGQATADAIGLKSAAITSLDVTQADTVITVDLTVLSTQDLTMDRPVPTNWRFDWENRGNGWELQRIEPLESRQVGQGELLSHMK